MAQTPGEILNGWAESAYYWEKHQKKIAALFAPITEAMLEEAQLHAGVSVLDVAGGVGEPSFTIAERLSKQGSVICTDAVAEMVAAAQREARRRALTNIAFKQCLADSLPFPDASFDLVICRLGAFFFPEPIPAFRQMLRVTRPGGRIVLAVWKDKEENPYLSVPTEIISRHVPPPPEDPDSPGPFRFSELGLLATLLARAGAERVRERVLEFRIATPLTLDEFCEMRLETSDSMRSKLATLSEAERDLVTTEVKDAVRGYFPTNTINMPAKVLIVSGEKQK